MRDVARPRPPEDRGSSDVAGRALVARACRDARRSGPMVVGSGSGTADWKSAHRSGRCRDRRLSPRSATRERLSSRSPGPLFPPFHGALVARSLGALVVAVWLGASTAAQDSPPAPDSEALLAARQQLVFRHALQVVAPAIVRIDTIGGAQPVRREQDATQGERVAPAFRQADGPTTGLIWSADGYILTSSINFARDPAIITVTLADGRRFVARLIARDRPARLALLKIDATALPTPAWVDSAALRCGQWALAAGLGQDSAGPALTVGILSALHRAAGLAVQTDAKISPANYGGPLFDIEGRVIGICVPMGPGEDEFVGVEWYDSGIGFAVPYECVRQRVPLLQAGRDLHRGLLGVIFDSDAPPVSTPDAQQEPAQPAAAGLRISAQPLGPAAAAGLRAGDVITHVDGVPTLRLLDFRRALARRVAGDVVTVSYRRGAESASVSLTLAGADELRGPASQPQK